MISNSSKHHFKSFPIRGGYVEVSAKQKITLSTDKVSELNGWMGEGVENVNLLDFKHTHAENVILKFYFLTLLFTDNSLKF